VTEDQIVAWANQTVAASGKASHMTSFRWVGGSAPRPYVHTLPWI
jgi:hypothetical protein